MEYRKGNLVICNGSYLSKIISIKNYNVKAEKISDVKIENENSHIISGIHGVPLTIERVKMLGFKDSTNGWGGSQGCDYHYNKNNVSIQTYDSDSYWHLEGNFKIIFKYVHELQNYYFKKTKSELI